MKATLKKHRIFFIVLIAVIGLTVLFTVNYVRINRMYPNPTLETYQLNQPVSYHGFEITAKKFQMLDSETLIKQYKIDDEDEIKFLRVCSMQNILITVTIKNTSKEEQALSTALENCNIQSFIFANGIEDSTFFLYNSKDSYKPKLKSGEETTIILPSGITKQQCTKENWNNIHSRKFDLVVATYPVKKSIRLN